MDSTHWVNNFWGKDDAGYHQLMQRLQGSKQTCDELRHFYKERMAIEQDYAKKLNSLAHRALGSNETGDMKQSMETVRSTTKATAATHETVARQINEQLLGPLVAFTNSMKNRNRTTEDMMAQLTKAKNSQNNSTEKTRGRYLAECNKISGFQAQQNLLMGKELDKNDQKLDRATYQVEGFQRQYQDGLKALAQSIEVWNAEWRVSCDKLEQIEEERLTFTKSNLWAFANAISAACVAVDEGCESVRTSLERCDPARDLELFSKEHGTGSQIQDPPEFVNFLQGFSRDSDGDEGRYHMANFESSLDPETHQGSMNRSAGPSGSIAASTGPSMGAVPDLQLSASPSSQGSPQMGSQYTPMSSPGTTSLEYEKSENADREAERQQQQLQQQMQQKEIEKQEKKKNRRSWAMPFKRKSNPDFTFQPISALDQPTPSSSFQRLSDFNAEPVAETTRLPNQRNSWAPAAAAPQSSGGIGISSSNEDPLLAALEKLKAPTQARPKSMAPSSGTSAAPRGPNMAPSSNTFANPYGNGQRSPVQHSADPQISPKRSPVQRKKVGSGSQYPGETSDGRKVLRHSRAQYDYRAAIPEEVTFKRGDVLLITEMQEDGWWDCEVLGRHAFGLAPSNFLADA